MSVETSPKIVEKLQNEVFEVLQESLLGHDFVDKTISTNNQKSIILIREGVKIWT